MSTSAAWAACTRRSPWSPERGRHGRWPRGRGARQLDDLRAGSPWSCREQPSGISPRMQPTAHMSTPLLYCVDPRESRGAVPARRDVSVSTGVGAFPSRPRRQTDRGRSRRASRVVRVEQRLDGLMSRCSNCRCAGTSTPSEAGDDVLCAPPPECSPGSQRGGPFHVVEREVNVLVVLRPMTCCMRTMLSCPVSF